ncbi:unnamed protein product, partial [Prorocentrum cordatum]
GSDRAGPAAAAGAQGRRRGVVLLRHLPDKRPGERGAAPDRRGEGPTGGLLARAPRARGGARRAAARGRRGAPGRAAGELRGLLRAGAVEEFALRGGWADRLVLPAADVPRAAPAVARRPVRLLQAAEAAAAGGRLRARVAAPCAAGQASLMPILRWGRQAASGGPRRAIGE